MRREQADALVEEIREKCEDCLLRMRDAQARALRPHTPSTRYNAKEVAAIFGVREGDVLSAIRGGQLHAPRLSRGPSGQYRIRLDDAESWFSEIYLPARQIPEET